MPKMKTHSGAKKRFKKRSSGKISRRQATAAHNLTKKTSKRKRGLRQTVHVHNTDQSRVNRLLAS
ncbi:MAG: 50S ribosomal protein L35 [Gemmatimonadota bacterium]|nr:50S ribosomal protein L35 [Gemmatimonadota bacterium]